MLDGLYKLEVNEPESFSRLYKNENPDVVIWSVMSGPDEYELMEQGFMHLLSHLTPDTKLVYMSSDLVFSDGNGPYEERSEEHTSELQSRFDLVCRLLLEKKTSTHTE